jgi:hypothetical protein
MFKYRKIPRWKYVTLTPYRCYVGILLGNNVDHPYVKIKNGYVEIKEGYMWDGAIFCPDVLEIMRASLVHDALYQMMREGLVRQERRKNADLILKMICQEDGMNPILVKFVYWTVRIFAGYASKIKEDEED